jgi:Gamma-glutamyl cyclotransferase, AIG2-like
MPRLFSYGSLQQPAVQLATFGRLLAGSRDALVGFELRNVRHGDKQLANVIRSARADSRVGGTTFEITDAELAATDLYERGDAYTRIPATLASGGEAWVYVEAASIS